MTVLLASSFLNLGISAAPNTAGTEPDYTQIEIEPNDGFTTEDIKELLKNIEYDILTMKSDYVLGDQTMTDFVNKTNSESLDGLDDEYKNQRGQFLYNLQNSPSETKDKQDIKKVTPEEINLAIEANSKPEKVKVKNIKTILKKDKKQYLLDKTKNNNKLKKVEEQEPKYQKQSTLEKLKQDGKNLLAKAAKVGSVSADAQVVGTAQAWVPNFSSVSFFDTDELGMFLFSDWRSNQTLSALATSQPSVAFGNGRMLVVIKGTDNKVYMGNWDSNGNDFKGWSEVGGGWVTNDAPAIEWYWGRIYVSIRGTNNQIYYRWSGDNGVTWNGWFGQGGGTLNAPTLRRLDNRLYNIVRGTDNYIYYQYQDNGTNSWTGWTRWGNWQTNNRPVAAAANGRFYVGISGLDGKAYVNNNATAWSDTNWKTIRNGVNNTFAMAGYNGKFCFLFRDPDGQFVQQCTNDATLATINFQQRTQFGSAYPPAMGADYGLTQVGVGDGVFKIGTTGNGQVVNNNGAIYQRLLRAYPNARGYLSEMNWSDYKNTSQGGFGPNGTYEHEVLLYRGSITTPTPNIAYLSNGSSPLINSTPPKGCMPTVKYWTSSLPSAYLDTRLNYNFTINPYAATNCDSDTDEVSYSIGTSNVYQLENFRQYFNYMVTDEGARDRPAFKISAQKGEMRPNWCGNRNLCLSSIPIASRYTCNDTQGDTWCSFDTDRQILTSDTAGQPGFNTTLSQSTYYPYWYWTFTH